MFAAGRQSEQPKEEAATANGEQRQRRRDRTDARNHAQSGRLIPQRSLFLHRLPSRRSCDWQLILTSARKEEGRQRDSQKIPSRWVSANLSHQRHESLDRTSS